jgi:hypothetical protein
MTRKWAVTLRWHEPHEAVVIVEANDEERAEHRAWLSTTASFVFFDETYDRAEIRELPE